MKRGVDKTINSSRCRDFFLERIHPNKNITLSPKTIPKNKERRQPQDQMNVKMNNAVSTVKVPRSSLVNREMNLFIKVLSAN